MSDMKTEVPAATAFTHWGTCPEPAMATFVMRKFGKAYPQRTPRILDIGCGAGAQSLWIAERGFVVNAIDVEQEAISELRFRLRPWHAITSSVTNVTDLRDRYSDAAMDAAVDVCTLQHLDHDQVRKALAEIYRVLKPGGWLFSMTASLEHDVDAFGGHYARRESFASARGVYEVAGFRVEPLREQVHTYTGCRIGHVIIEAQKS